MMRASFVVASGTLAFYTGALTSSFTLPDELEKSKPGAIDQMVRTL